MNLEEGLSILEEGIVKARLILDGWPTNMLFTAEEYMKYYDCVFLLCTQKHTYTCPAQLYERFRRGLKESIVLRVLPSFIGKNDASLLIELLCMWANYKVMARCLVAFFQYIDRHFVESNKIASLNDVSVCCFCELVCNEFYQRFQDVVLSLISQDREGKLVDRGLIKNVVNFFVEMGGCGNKYYDNLEKAVLENSANFYSRLATDWLSCCSSNDYVLKVEWCMNQQKERASQYFYPTTVDRLMQVMHRQLMNKRLIEKYSAERSDLAAYQDLLSGCASLSIGDGSFASPL